MAAAATHQPSEGPTHHRSHFDELRWVIQIRSALEQEVEDDHGVSVSIFNVPKLLQLTKPEAYVPQFISLGPYHHWRPDLYEMERHKLAAAKRAQKRFQCLKLHDLVEQFKKLEHKIRAHYHRHLDFGGETLAWMMAVDASFLLDFLQVYATEEDISKIGKRISSRMSHLLNNSGNKSAHDVVLQDIMMLENQIPLFLAHKILELQCTNTQVTDETLSKMLMGFLKEICPFKMKENFSVAVDVPQHAHLLELLYYFLVPNFEERDDENNNNDIEAQADDEAKLAKTPADGGPVKQLLNNIWNFASRLSGGPISCIKVAIVSRPVKLMVKLPWKTLTSIPGFSILTKPAERFFSFYHGGEKDPSSSSHNINKPPKVEEIMIPSVCELVDAGVSFSPTNGDLTTIMFDVKTAIFYLPTVTLDVNTEVILRNMVAYEASAAPGPLLLARYTELMNGIIDTEQDVKILREKGVIKNRMKSDGQVANLWNGMSRCVRLTRVPFLDKVIEDVNKYHSSRWRVKTKKFLNKYVFGSWQFLTFLAAILLLFLTALQAFCSIYTCSRWFGTLTARNK